MDLSAQSIGRPSGGRFPMITARTRQGLAALLVAVAVVLELTIIAWTAELGTAAYWLAGCVVLLAGAGVAGLLGLAGDRAADPGVITRLLAESLDVSDRGVVVTGPDGMPVYANPAYRQAVRCDAKGCPDLSLLTVGSPDAAAVVERLATQGMAGAAASDSIHVEVDGESKWLKLTAKPLADAADHIVWFVDDDTDRREMELAIHEEQDKLADFLDNAPVGFYSIGADGRFLFINNTLAGWLGYEPAELVRSELRLADVEVDRVSTGKVVDEDGERSGSGRLRRRNGEEFDVEIRQSVVYDETGKPLRTRSVVRDVTQENELQAALKMAEEHFQRFFDFAPVGIVMVDPDGRIQDDNAALAAMLEEPAEEIVGHSLASIVQDSDVQVLRDRLAEALEAERPSGPVEVRIGGRGSRVAQVFSSRVVDHEGQVSGVVLHFIDSTDQRQLELQFAQSQKMQAVGQLAGGVAHDFNNLLTAIIGFCDLLLLRHQPGDESFADIMQIKQNSNRAANLVRQLLAFSRRQTLRPSVLEVTDVLAELSHLLRRLIGEGIELEIRHTRDLWPVRVDQGQFEQVVINLVVNARDAMSGNGAVSISTRNETNAAPRQMSHEVMPPGDYTVIEITDTGTGIPKEHLEKIFEPFFTTKEVGAGTGLGLSTVFGIIKQTGGYIHAESEPGRGASFQIYLPRHQPSQAELAEQSVESADSVADLTGIGTILLVEDEDAVRLFASRALRRKGYTVLEANSGFAALDLLDEHEGGIDLLVSDVVMPAMDGPTLSRHVLERFPTTKVIFISGYAESEFRANLESDAEISFLPKPFSLNQLAAKVKDVMEAPAD